MGEVADATLAAGGRVVGVIPESLKTREVGHAGLHELHVVPTMHLRKQMMAERADAFIALPGGIGTLEELYEVWTWRQLGYHDQPIGLLNVDGYYDDLLRFMAHTRRRRASLRRVAARALLQVGTRRRATCWLRAGARRPRGPRPPRRLLARLSSRRPPPERQTAASSVSPVRMRTTCSTEVTKILPSPILPVLAALTMASMQRSTSSSLTTTSTFTLGRKSTTYSAPRYSSVWPFWRPKPLTSVTVRPGHADVAQRFAHFLELEGLDDGGDLFHGGLRSA